IIGTTQKSHLRPSQVRHFRLRPRPRRIANRCDGRLSTARRKIYQEIADLSFRDRLQMFAQCINCPTGLILRWIDRWPRFPYKINYAGLEALGRLLLSSTRSADAKLRNSASDVLSKVLLLLTALGLAGCVDTFARRDDAKCRAMGAQRGTDRYDNCRVTLKE